MMRHEPAARRLGAIGLGLYVPDCNTPDCAVLTDLADLPYTHADEARDVSERLHREAEHGPDEPGTLGGWEAI